MKFRKKPIVVEAMQYTDEQVNEIVAWVGGARAMRVNWENDAALEIVTLEGVMTASLNDWIIKGIKGEFYPCKSDIFEATYEEVSDD